MRALSFMAGLSGLIGDPHRLMMYIDMLVTEVGSASRVQTRSYSDRC